jgi:hypothetical protein
VVFARIEWRRFLTATFEFLVVSCREADAVSFGEGECDWMVRVRNVTVVIIENVSEIGIGRARAFGGWLVENRLQRVPRTVQSSGELLVLGKGPVAGLFFLTLLIGCSNHTPFFLHPSRTLEQT